MGECLGSSYKAVMTLVLLCLAHFLVDFMLGIWPIYKMMASLDLAKAGFIVAVAAFLGEGAQIGFGVFSDRGYRKQLVIFGVLAATSSIFLAYSREYFPLFILYLITCLGSGAFHPTAAGIVSNLNPNRRFLLMTLFTAAGAVGLASSQMVFKTVFQAFHGNTLLLLIPTLLLVSFLLFYTFPSVKRDKVGKGQEKGIFSQFFKRDELRNLYFAQVAQQSILWGTIFMLPNALNALGHSEWVCLGGGHLCFIFGSALMMIPAGYLADKYSARKVLLVANSAACVFFYLFLFSEEIPPLLVLPMLVLLGAFFGIGSPVAVAFGNRLVPEQPGAVSAFLMGMVWCVSEVIGPGGAGYMSTLFPEHGPVKALALLGFFFFIAIYATYLLPEEAPAERVQESIPS